MARVTVLTAGRHGATHEVGEAIAARLRKHGHDACAVEAGARSELDPDSAIVLGSAIYVGRWLKAARKLAARLASEPQGHPIWLFSVGPIGEPPEPELPAAEQLAGADAVKRARGYRAFSGLLDREGLGRLERAAVNAQDAPDGDFRDWAGIERWADEIAGELNGTPALQA